VAVGAVLGALEDDGLLAAEGGLLEVELDRVAEVAPGRRLLAREPEQIAEQGVEELRRPGDVGGAERAGAPLDGAEAVVVRPLVLVGEDGVGDRQLLEALLRRLVAGVAIGVPLERQAPVGGLDLDVRRAPVDPQGCVVVQGQGG
jgi:hypothetical protein